MAKVVSADTLKPKNKNVAKSKSNGLDLGKLTDLVGDNKELIGDLAETFLGGNDKKSKKTKKDDDSLLENLAETFLGNDKKSKKDDDSLLGNLAETFLGSDNKKKKSSASDEIKKTVAKSVIKNMLDRK